MTSVEGRGAPVERPEGFELAEAWKLIADEVDQRRAPVRATARAAPGLVEVCRAAFGTRVRIGPTAPDGRVQLELRGHSPRRLAAEVARFGGALEVVEPPEVRAELAALAGQLTDLYGRS